jgi:phosphinothricin acetyltransferase
MPSHGAGTAGADARDRIAAVAAAGGALGVKLRLATAEDAAAVAAIYADYVTGTAVSFETEPPGEAEIRARISAGGGLYPWLASCDEAGRLLGYAYAAAFRARRAYRFTVETTVYVDPDAQGRGVGRSLYTALIPLLVRQGFTQAIAAITLPNEASVRLHEAFGFTKAGTYRQVGYKLGEWRSVGLWQRALAPLGDPPEEPKPFAGRWQEAEFSGPGSSRSGR